MEALGRIGGLRAVESLIHVFRDKSEDKGVRYAATRNLKNRRLEDVSRVIHESA